MTVQKRPNIMKTAIRAPRRDPGDLSRWENRYAIARNDMPIIEYAHDTYRTKGAGMNRWKYLKEIRSSMM